MPRLDRHLDAAHGREAPIEALRKGLERRHVLFGPDPTQLVPPRRDLGVEAEGDPPVGVRGQHLDGRPERAGHPPRAGGGRPAFGERLGDKPPVGPLARRERVAGLVVFRAERREHRLTRERHRRRRRGRGTGGGERRHAGVRGRLRLHEPRGSRPRTPARRPPRSASGDGDAASPRILRLQPTTVATPRPRGSAERRPCATAPPRPACSRGTRGPAGAGPRVPPRGPSPETAPMRAARRPGRLPTSGGRRGARAAPTRTRHDTWR